ncbi:hypothetical protein FA15DRAFT_752133 [Coprinopsis marcescibilis]|uniref:BRCT domain-containing protein n=1 Tax=Coprinopsis marcescibilis TaxID=230819 RepID=A0A5C3LAC5_COPMA|nr:hypothetical protein FA15DRAFT_752133 [Coprinopsis marcescibilis]
MSYLEEETQATQLLDDLIPLKGPDSSPVAPARNRPTVVPAAGIADFYNPSRNPSSLPDYHLHGLAATQTQNFEEEAANEGSQKENIHAVRTATEPVNNPGTSSVKQTKDSSSKHQASNKTPHVDKAGHSLAQSHSKARTPNARPLPISSMDQIQSRFTSRPSHSKSSRSTHGAPPSRGRQVKATAHSGGESSRDSSQDSFARGESRDPEQPYMAQNKPFDIPIKDLARGNAFKDRMQATGSTYGYSLPRHNGPIIASPQGKLLVEATPSNSTGSQSDRSRLEDATQIIGRIQYAETSYSNQREEDYESEPASSLGASVLAGDYHPSPEPTQPATQTATQLYGFDSEGQGPSGTSVLPYQPQTHGTGQSVPQTNNTTNSLIRHLPDQRRRHYERIAAAAPNVAPPPPIGNINLQETQTTTSGSTDFYATQPTNAAGQLWQDTQPTTQNNSNWQDTQPVNIGVRFAQHAHPVSRSSPVTQSPIPGLGIYQGRRDQMEIVPDSEAQHSSPLKRVADIEMASDDGHCPSPILMKPLSRTEPVPASDVEDRSDEASDESDDDHPPAKKRAVVIESESEEEVPIVQNVGKGKGKGKGKTTFVVPKPVIKAKTTRKPEVTKTYGRATRSTRYAGSSENTIIPSSVPEQDMLPEPEVKGKVKSKEKGKGSGKGKGKAAIQGRRVDARFKGRQDATNEDSEDLDETAGNEDPTLEQAEEEIAVEPGPSNKRKRGKKAAKPPAKVKREKTPPTKRLRSTMASAKRNDNATRVFALWKPNNLFYSGTIFAAEDPMYEIKFDDGQHRPVTIDEIRRCELRVGDEVICGNRNIPCDIVSVNGNAIGVKYNGEDEIFRLDELRISHKTIKSAWKDREVDKDAIVPLTQPEIGSPSRRPVGKNLLAETGMVLTLSVSNATWEKDKERVVNAAKESGATIFEDIADLFSLVGKWFESGNRWVITKDEFKFSPKHTIRRLFLLADTANQKPKYLMAIALGIPILSTQWLHESVEAGEEKNWMPYLLPQGHSDLLGIRLTQQVDADWGSSSDYLKDIMSNAVPTKLFKGASVLCVGPDMLPRNKGKRQPEFDQRAQEATNALGRVMLCMGADLVEAVLEPKYAGRPLESYTYIVTRNRVEGDAYSELPRARLVDWSWVKACIVGGRLFDLPEIGISENSQEA